MKNEITKHPVNPYRQSERKNNTKIYIVMIDRGYLRDLLKQHDHLEYHHGTESVYIVHFCTEQIRAKLLQFGP